MYRHKTWTGPSQALWLLYVATQNMNWTVSGTVVTICTDTKHELDRLRHCGYYMYRQKTWTYPNRICLCVSPDSQWLLRWTTSSRLVFVIETGCLLWRGCWGINLSVEKMPKAASSTAKERVVCRQIRGSNWGSYSVDNHHTLLRATSEGTAAHTVETHQKTEQDRLRNFGSYVARLAVWW